MKSCCFTLYNNRKDQSILKIIHFAIKYVYTQTPNVFKFFLSLFCEILKWYNQLALFFEFLIFIVRQFLELICLW